MAGGLTVFISASASVHVILTKKNARSAFSWIGIIWLVPVLGAVLYLLFGINRIKRKARMLRSSVSEVAKSFPLQKALSEESLPLKAQFKSLSMMIDRIAEFPLLPGNQIIPLEDGDRAYPEMLRAINEAEDTINLSTYIFDNDRVGEAFVEALHKAQSRGVKIRIIIDDMGTRYSFPPITRKLKRLGIRYALFLPTLLPTRLPFVNLRNHRKIMVVDGRIGFTGGMNIREGHMLKLNPSNPVRDIHFLVKGPVVSHMQQVFLEDWYFCTGEVLKGKRWFPEIEPAGRAWARGIPDGPDEDFEKHLLTIQSAVTVARKSIKIVTPYFLPEENLITALNLASLRGVEIDILLPEKNNIPLIKWASFNILEHLLNDSCRIWLSPPPFDHSKIMIVDDQWVLIGSGNWDARSFRLNFEFNIECYDETLSKRLSAIVDRKISEAKRVDRDFLTSRPLTVKIRDGVSFLLSPYL
ncbi:MAG: cardiolipin synthase [Nitrospirae bacterium]|nr:MAG: cardiolipin synthase [Nitrospirota bacterium]